MNNQNKISVSQTDETVLQEFLLIYLCTFSHQFRYEVRTTTYYNIFQVQVIFHKSIDYFVI